MNDDVATAHAQVVSLLGRLYRMVSREDISQEAWAAFYDSGWAPDGPVRPVEADTGSDAWETYTTAIKAVKKEMRGATEKYCRREKAAAEGYRVEDEQFYSIGSLRVLLEAYFAGGITESPPKSHEHSVSRPTKVSGQGDYLVSLLDVGAALARLPGPQAVILWCGYSPDYAGRTDEEISMELRSQGWEGLTVERFTGRLRTALSRLLRELGGAQP